MNVNALPDEINSFIWRSNNMSAALCSSLCRCGENFILRNFIVPLTHNLFGSWVVQCREGLIGELANEVFPAINFNWIECHGGLEDAVVALSLRCRCRFTFIIFILNQFFYIFHKINIKVLGGAPAVCSGARRHLRRGVLGGARRPLLSIPVCGA